MISSTPRFSVVVPAHNEAASLPATLASLAAQTCDGGYEVIVVDNGSDDDTARIARDAGVRVVREDVLGVCRARQTGVEAAQGSIVVSTDADTVHPPDWLARIGFAFADAGRSNRGSSLAAVAGPCRYLDPPWWASMAPPIAFTLVDLVSRLSGRVIYLSATNVAFCRELFPGYDVALHQGGDEADLLRRLRRIGRVQWDSGNVVLTSSRRMREGLLHTVLVSYGWYYLGQRLFRRLRPDHIVAPAPPVRAGDERRSARRRRRWRIAAAGGLAVALALRTSGRQRAAPGHD